MSQMLPASMLLPCSLHRAGAGTFLKQCVTYPNEGSGFVFEDNGRRWRARFDARAIERASADESVEYLATEPPALWVDPTSSYPAQGGISAGDVVLIPEHGATFAVRRHPYRNDMLFATLAGQLVETYSWIGMIGFREWALIGSIPGTDQTFDWYRRPAAEE